MTKGEVHAVAVSRARRRLGLIICVLVVIAAGLVLRRFGYDLGLPFLVVKFGGSVLWGAMVYLLCALVAYRARPLTTASVAMAIAVAVELSRLYHLPSLDVFRLTTAGALLLGRVFSVWNMIAYAVGISAACLVEALLRRRSRG